jgi:DNA-binding NtrC family response regulator
MNKPPNPVGVGPTVRRQRPVDPEETDLTYALTVLEGPDAGRTFMLAASSPTRALLGTSPVCSVRLSDREVSRRHAAISVRAAGAELIDLGSMNGTTVNGVLVKEVTLRGGEAVRVGATTLSFARADAGATPIGTTTSFGRAIGQSIAMRRLYPLVERLAAGDGPILVEGEPGTGKELLAEEIHRASSRAGGPFVVLESSTLPADQIGARLFGSADEPGLIESARSGFLMIDEVADLPRNVQRRLRDRIAATNDVRIVAATRQDLDRAVTAGRFDDALFFALGTGRIELPPLRERRGDVEVLANHFWEQVASKTATVGPDLPNDLLPRFEDHRWPGNVRELLGVVTQRATLGELPPAYFSNRALESGGDMVATVIQDGLPFPAARDRVLDAFERRYVEAMLERHGGNVGAAARASGIALRYFQVVRKRSR